jgi:hypothetical protein
MIRPFDWRDLALLHQLRHRGICLDAQTAYTRGPQTLQQALLDAILPGRRVATLVGRPSNDQEEPVVGQVAQRNSETYARLVFLGPTEALGQSIGGRMLDALTAAAGENGAHHLIAEVDENSPVFERLRRAGYAVYARQRVWSLKERKAEGPEDGPPLWVEEGREDELAISDLYHAVVPALVQQVEGSPGCNGKGMVYAVDGEVLGYLGVARGPLGKWVIPYFHPAEEDPEALLVNYISRLDDRLDHPLHFCIRSYQSWMNGVLERLEFEPIVDQAVMVKRLVAVVKKPAFGSLRALEGTRPEPTVPFAQLGNRKSTSRGR